MLKHGKLTDSIIKAYYEVYNILGYGFLEKVYENSMLIELRARGHKAVKQEHIDVFFKGHNVGDYYADIIVDDTIIIELKAASSLCEKHECQLINYLKATNIEVGLLFNFGKDPEFKRKVFSNKYKKNIDNERN